MAETSHSAAAAKLAMVEISVAAAVIPVQSSKNFLQKDN